MKFRLVLALVLVCGAASAWAQVDATASAAGVAPIKVTDTEATIIMQTINGYMQGATHRGRLEILDRRKGQLVSLRLDKIVADDPTRIVFPAEGQIAVCGECTEMTTVVAKNGEKTEEETATRYEVWFVVQRGGIASSRVLDTFIKSANGKPMYRWVQDSEGKWSATLIPEGEE